MCDCVFFFSSRRRHTRCSRDWSSDVCSSDLLEVYGHDGLPVLSADGHQIQGWITAQGVLRAIARQITTAQAQSTQAQVSADWEHADPESLLRHPPTPLPGYQVAEITITAGSPAAGRKLGDVTWP